MRHVPRVHRVDVDWLLEKILTDTGINIRYINTKAQIADIFTKGSFTEITWKVLCRLFQVGMPGFWESKSNFKSSQKFTYAQLPAEAGKGNCSSSLSHAPQLLAQDVASPSPPRVVGTALVVHTVESTMQPSVVTPVPQVGAIDGSFPPAPPPQPAAEQAVSPPQGMLANALTTIAEGAAQMLMPLRASAAGCGSDQPQVTPKAPPSSTIESGPIMAVATDRALGPVTRDQPLPNPRTILGPGFGDPMRAPIQVAGASVTGGGIPAPAYYNSDSTPWGDFCNKG